MARLLFFLMLVCSTVPAFAQAPQDSGTYRINVGDEIEIYVWGEERLQRVVRVLPDGSFAFPLIGRIDALGRPTSEIEQIVTAGLQSQYRGEVPQVTVSVQSPGGWHFSIMGKVRSPGTFSPGRYVNLLEALSIAGGPDEFAKLDGIVIIRKTSEGLRAIPAEMADLFRGGSSATRRVEAGLPMIQSGDTVIVP